MTMMPVDRLADLKREKRAIQAEINQLRKAILAGEVDPVGQYYVARIDHRLRLKPINEQPHVHNGSARMHGYDGEHVDEYR